MTWKLWIVIIPTLLMALGIGGIIGYQLRPMVTLVGTTSRPSPSHQGLTFLPDESRKGAWNCIFIQGKDI